MATTYCIIKTTCKSKKNATEIAKILLEKKLIACAQIVPIESFYIWKNKMEKGKEFLLMLKSKSNFYPAIEKAILENHEYEVPQIILVPIEDGFRGYFNWLEEQLS